MIPVNPGDIISFRDTITEKSRTMKVVRCGEDFVTVQRLGSEYAVREDEITSFERRVHHAKN